MNKVVQVPLWVAVYLKKLNKCRIYPPKWLTVEYLRGFKEAESISKDALTQLPQNYYEIA